MNGWKTKRGVYLIAEIGGNHEGDFSYAKRLTKLACGSGVDAVKYQIYTGDSLVNKLIDPQRHDHFKKFELKPEHHIELAKMCKDAGVTYLASVWDMDALKWIDPWLKFYKIGSGDLTAFPIIEKIAKMRKPIILSTGLATLEEIRETIYFLQKINKMYKKKEFLAILQCTSMYPIPNRCVNLRVMDTFKKKFGLTIGYSDHTEGTKAVEIAVAMGAEILEMHFTDTRKEKKFRDHKVSFTKREIISLIKNIDTIKTLQGTGVKMPMDVEIESGHVKSFRRAMYPKRDLPKGSKITKNNIITLRPNIGLDAKKFHEIIGRKANRDLKILEKIEENDFL